MKVAGQDHVCSKARRYFLLLLIVVADDDDAVVVACVADLEVSIGVVVATLLLEVT
jgi:hypothetical protein